MAPSSSDAAGATVESGAEAIMSLEDHLSPDLRGPATTIAWIAAGLSGAGIYRVEAAGQSFVPKVAAESEDAANWRGTGTVLAGDLNKRSGRRGWMLAGESGESRLPAPGLPLSYVFDRSLYEVDDALLIILSTILSTLFIFLI
jgi:hypothetical protein